MFEYVECASIVRWIILWWDACVSAQVIRSVIQNRDFKSPSYIIFLPTLFVDKDSYGLRKRGEPENNLTVRLQNANLTSPQRVVLF